MAAVIKLVPQEHWELLKSYLDEDGIILMPEGFFCNLPDETQRDVREAAKNYDFGGEPDVAVEFVSKKNHYLFYCANDSYEEEDA